MSIAADFPLRLPIKSRPLLDEIKLCVQVVIGGGNGVLRECLCFAAQQLQVLDLAMNLFSLLFGQAGSSLLEFLLRSIDLLLVFLGVILEARNAKLFGI